MSFPCKAEHLRPGYRIAIGSLKLAPLVKSTSSWMVVHLVYCNVKSRQVHITLTSPAGGKGFMLRMPPNHYFRTEKQVAVV